MGDMITGGSQLTMLGTGLFMMFAALEATIRVLSVSSQSEERAETVARRRLTEEPPRAGASTLVRRLSW